MYSKKIGKLQNLQFTILQNRNNQSDQFKEFALLKGSSIKQRKTKQ